MKTYNKRITKCEECPNFYEATDATGYFETEYFCTKLSTKGTPLEKRQSYVSVSPNKIPQNCPLQEFKKMK